MSYALPGTTSGIGYVEPDIIGEAMILQVFGNKRVEVIVRAVALAPALVIGTIIRIVQDFSTDDIAGKPMEWLRALIEAGKSDNPRLLTFIVDGMPINTLALREKATRSRSFC